MSLKGEKGLHVYIAVRTVPTFDRKSYKHKL